MTIDTRPTRELNPPPTRPTSELNPPYNITPSTRTTLIGILVLLPLTLLIIGLYTGTINP